MGWTSDLIKAFGGLLLIAFTFKHFAVGTPPM